MMIGTKGKSTSMTFLGHVLISQMLKVFSLESDTTMS